ncbi:hypothetical protein BGZ90_000581 [Linnemannia elongata]|nr:hypothetical protein BGZ90_000581 [Linnemannia elongata]
MASSQTMELKVKLLFVDFTLCDITITITCHGDGVVFPHMLEVEVSLLKDTVASFKDLIFDKAEEKGFNMEGIDPEAVFIGFQDDAYQAAEYYHEGKKLKDFENVPRYAFLGHYLSAM